MSEERSAPRILASTVLSFEKRTVTFFAPSTTWALVRIVPLLSITKPEPVALPFCDSGAPKMFVSFLTTSAVMKTTPFESRW
ncbi:unannotated protein [freshwater metagenome]|uniref:Unannotated protein n=1 Tax=freshwater metagenome TaxID=449393 RepID=A0A6J5ZZ70_9ZZZZ